MSLDKQFLATRYNMEAMLDRVCEERCWDGERLDSWLELWELPKGDSLYTLQIVDELNGVELEHLARIAEELKSDRAQIAGESRAIATMIEKYIAWKRGEYALESD